MSLLLLRRREIMGMPHGESAPSSISLPFTLAQTIINMSTGAATFNSSWYATDYIEIPDGASAVTFVNEAGANVYFRGAFYDSSQGYLSSGLTSVWTINTGRTSSKTVPSGAKYIRLSTNTTALFNTTQSLGLTY